MGALLAVTQGSQTADEVIVCDTAAGEGAQAVVMVGKGLP